MTVQCMLWRSLFSCSSLLSVHALAEHNCLPSTTPCCLNVQARAYFHKVVKASATSVIQAKAREVYLDPAASAGSFHLRDGISLTEGTWHDICFCGQVQHVVWCNVPYMCTMCIAHCQHAISAKESAFMSPNSTGFAWASVTYCKPCSGRCLGC